MRGDAGAGLEGRREAGVPLCKLAVQARPALEESLLRDAEVVDSFHFLFVAAGALEAGGRGKQGLSGGDVVVELAK